MANRLMKVLALAIAVTGLSVGAVHAAGDVKHPESNDWSHAGPFGTYDQHAVQRGFQVYKEVCANCHGLKYVAFRNLLQIGFSEDQAKAIAAEYSVPAEPNLDGDIEDRAAKLFDYFPSPFPNAKAAAASNGGVAPPDLSLMSKARADGDNYIKSLLTGYATDGDNHHCSDTNHYNPYFPGGCIAMGAPLFDDLVEYVDGTPATTEQMAHDVASFLAWAAEPHMEERKQMGVKVILFLIFLSVLLYLAKKRIWGRLH